jgi:DNA polymerase I-like protein with 3'-5' exonuclease and polymerase domains
VYDLETNGLIPDPWQLREPETFQVHEGRKNRFTPVTKIHCLVTFDVDARALACYWDAPPLGADKSLARAGSLGDGLRAVLEADIRIGHNIVGYDDKVIRLLHPEIGGRLDIDRARDTMVGARVCWPDEHLKALDYIKSEVLKKHPASPQFPKQLMGRHSLKAWGYRLGLSKDTAFKYEDFSTFTRDMLEQCARDVRLTAMLFAHLENRRTNLKRFTTKAWTLEQRFADHLERQRVNGVRFDAAKADRLARALMSNRAEVDAELRAEFPPWTVVSFTPAKKLRREKVVEFNPQSDRHVAKVLMERGWKPTVFNADGSPSVKEDVLKGVTVKGVELIRERGVLGMRLGQLAEGKNKNSTPWMKCVKADGRIHGVVNHNAAVTSRSTHRSPNMSAVPRLVDNYGQPTPYGRECRELFTATPGWRLVGGDAKGLELRMLAHWLAEYDGGAYADVVVNGDVHAFNMKAAGLSSREQAKRYIYADLYGAGNAKKAAVLGCPVAEAKKISARLMKNIPALAKLKADLNRTVLQHGMVKTLDGRWLFVRSGYAALNTLLQGSGAIVMKATSVLYPKILEQEHALVQDVDYKQVLFSHDEVQIDCTPRAVEPVQAALKKAVVEAGRILKVRCPLAFDTRVGDNWAETH